MSMYLKAGAFLISTENVAVVQKVHRQAECEHGGVISHCALIVHLRVPITIVPGHLSTEEVEHIA